MTTVKLTDDTEMIRKTKGWIVYDGHTLRGTAILAVGRERGKSGSWCGDDEADIIRRAKSWMAELAR